MSTKKGSSNWRIFVERFSQNKKAIFIALVFLAAAVFIFTYNQIAIERMQYVQCAADSMCSLVECYYLYDLLGMFGALTFAFICFLFFRNDFRTDYVLRVQNKRKMWGRQVLQIFWLSVPFAVIMVAANFICDKVWHLQSMNWGQMAPRTKIYLSFENAYGFENMTSNFISQLQAIFAPARFWHIAALALLSCIIGLFWAGLIIQFVNWLTGGVIFGFILFLVLKVIDSLGILHMVYSNITLSYVIYTEPMNMVLSYLAAIGCIAIVIIACYFVADRKEFLHAQRK